ncbi:MAG: gamma-glutamylcyclotransferase [Rhodospirillales bacterium]
MSDAPLDPVADSAATDFEWIFGYGSLMWRPGFRFIEQRPARLDGYHRTPCIYSHHHRGTAAVPGLVLGLDKGGFCHGIAFKISINDRSQIIDYLHEREMIGYAYKPAFVDIGLGPEMVRAYTFIADPDHDHYAGDLGCDHAAKIIMRAQGISGLNRDYLMQTVQKLEDEGFAEPALIALRRKVQLLTGEIDRGTGI